MRKVFLIAAASAISLLATASAMPAPISGASALRAAVQSSSAVRTVEERCTTKCWTYRGERICRKRCYQS